MLALTTAYLVVNPQIYVGGYYAENDGGQGIFTWEAASVAVPDGGVIFVPNDYVSGPGRLVRALGGIDPTILQYGGDASGVRDSGPAWTAWAGGVQEKILIPPGTYTTSVPWLVPAGRALQGAGSDVCSLARFGSSVLTQLLGTVPATSALSTRDIFISGISIRGDATLKHGFKSSGAFFCVFQDIFVYDCTGSEAWGFSVTSQGFNDAEFVGGLIGTVLTVTGITYGVIHPGDALFGGDASGGRAAEVLIDHQVSGTPGGIGVYAVSFQNIVNEPFIDRTTGATGTINTVGFLATLSGVTVGTITGLGIQVGDNMSIALSLIDSLVTGILPPKTFVQSFGTGVGLDGTYNLALPDLPPGTLFALNSTAAFGNRNTMRDIFTSNCVNGRQMQKDVSDYTGFGNTACNLCYWDGGGNLGYTGIGDGIFSSQGFVYVRTQNQAGVTPAIGIWCSGQAGTILGATTDQGGVTDNPNLGKDNIYGFSQGRVLGATGIYFASPRTQIGPRGGGAPTGTSVFGQTGIGPAQRIDFDSVDTYGTVTILAGEVLGSSFPNIQQTGISVLCNILSPQQQSNWREDGAGYIETVDSLSQVSGNVRVAHRFQGVEKWRETYATADGTTSLIVGKTSAAIGTVGASLTSTGQAMLVVDNIPAARMNQLHAAGGVLQSFLTAGVIVGSISTTGAATAYNTSSDVRLKDAIVEISEARSGKIIDDLRPVDFAWKVGGKKDFGIIADEAQKVLPEVVTGEPGAVDEKGNIIPQQVDYSHFVPILLAELKHLRKRMKVLEGKIKA